MVKVLPQPKRAAWGSEVFYLDYQQRIVLESGGQELFLYARMLQQEILEDTGMCLAVIRGTGRRGDLVLRTQAEEGFGAERDTADKEDAKAPEGKLRRQGYRLSISPGGILIEGASRAGVMYGVQTLRQIIGQQGAAVSACEVEDWPDYGARGFYHDVTRGRVPTLETLKRLADCMCMYKLNQLQLYIEHTYLFRDFSEVWRDDTPLTAEEIMELDGYCREREIDLVPSLASFGHLYKVLRTDSYSPLCEMENSKEESFSFRGRMLHHTLNAADPRSMELSKSMIEEYMALFSSQYFNVCADETFDLGKGRCRAMVEEKGLEQVYMGYVGELCRFVADHGKIPMFWGDIICGFPEMIKDLPPQTICLTWGYAPNQSDEAVKKMADAHATQYVCSGVNGWNHWIPRYQDAYENIVRMCRYGREYGAVGVLNTDWGDFGQINCQDFSVPGLIYGAALSWNGAEMPRQEMNARISLLEYRDPSQTVMELFQALSEQEAVPWRLVCDFKELAQTKADAKDWEETFWQYAKEDGVLPMDPQRWMQRAEDKNRQIEQLKARLKEHLSVLDTAFRRRASRFLVAADAMKLTNRAAAMVIGGMDLNGGYSLEQRRQTASDLENWLYYYKEMWRETSKESELYRIQDLILWYADELRRI